MSGDATHELDLGREALVSFASRAAMMAFGFAGVVLFARILGPAGLGAYYLVMAAGQTITQMSNGIASAVKKRSSESGTDPGAYLSVGLLGHLAITVLVTAVGAIADPLLTRVFDVPNLVVSLVAIVFCLGLFQICNALFAGIGNPGYAAWADTARSVLTLLFQVGFVIQGWGPFGLVVGFAIASLLSGLGVWVASGVAPRVPTRAVVTSIREYARWSVPSALTSDLYGRVDILIVGALVGNTAVAFYEVALRLTQPGAFFSTSISDPLHVKVSGLSSRDLDVVPDLKNALSYAGLLSVPIFFGAVAMAVEIVQTVFGPEFTPAWTALIGLGLFQVLNGYAAPFEAAISGADRVRQSFSVSALVLLVHLPLAAGLGWAYGLMGVVAATVVAEVVRIALYQLLSRRLFDRVIVTLPVGEQLLAGAVMAGLVYWVTETVVAVRGWPWLLLVVGIGAAVYFGALAVLSEHFRETIDSVLPLRVPYSR